MADQNSGLPKKEEHQMNSVITFVTSHGSQIVQLAGNAVILACILGTVLCQALGKSLPWIDSTESKAKQILAWLPQFGIHPQVTALQAAYDDVKKQLDSQLAAQTPAPSPAPEAPAAAPSTDSKPAA